MMYDPIGGLLIEAVFACLLASNVEIVRAASCEEPLTSQTQLT